MNCLFFCAIEFLNFDPYKNGFMHHYFQVFFFSILIVACAEAEQPEELIVDEEVNYCDCNELAFDLPYNNFYLTEPREGFTGLCETFYSNGSLSLSKNFKTGKVHGDMTNYYESGAVQEIKSFDVSFQSGDHFYYTEDGTLLHHSKYKWGKQTEIIFPSNKP